MITSSCNPASSLRPLSGRSRRKFLLLAPTTAARSHTRPKSAPQTCRDLIRQLQALRGSVYVKESFLRPEDLRHGRHRSSVDEASWHLLLQDSDGRVCGCIRYRECGNNVDFSQLLLANSPLAHSNEWGYRLETAVEEELNIARMFKLPYVEVGGWALAEHVRGTSDAVRMALATYGLSQLLGGAVGISTARQNGSGPVLRKIGGRLLEHQGQPFPPYHDPSYRCMIEILRFYSWAPSRRFESWIEEIKAELCEADVLTAAPQELRASVAPYWFAEHSSHSHLKVS